MPRLQLRLLCFACVALPGVCGLSVRAESITLTPAADTSLFERIPDNNVGGAQSLAIGNTAAPDPTRALVKFAVATVLPTGARITSASLELTVVRASGLVEPATFELHRLLADWGEGDKGAGSITGAGGPADPGEATWNARFHPDQLWTAAGGGDGTDYASAPSATARLESSEPLIFGPSDAMKTDVQAWLDDPSTNFGWLLKDETESNATTARRFGSREDPANPPRLRVEYELARVVRISSTVLANGQFCLRFTVRAGKTYVVERRARMDDGLWNVITTLPPSSATEEVTVCDPLGIGNAFYRVGER